jgi:hypothetical protein
LKAVQPVAIFPSRDDQMPQFALERWASRE